MNRFKHVWIFIYLGVVLLILLAAGTKIAPAAAAVFDCASVTDVPQAECEKLVELYDNNNGTNWYDQDNWKVTNEVCNWYGITCNAGNTNVEKIYMHYNNLSGVFAVDFSGFAGLTFLRFSDNALSGDMDTIMGSYLPLSLDHLDLYKNQFSGTVPDITSFTNLTYLGISHNQLGGDVSAIIPNLPTSLVSLYMGNNNYTAAGTIPPSISNFTALQHFEITNVGLVNDFTTLVDSLPSTINYLYLDYNDLTGTFPSDMATELPNLLYLGLSHNSLNGNLTNDFGYLPNNLNTIDLNQNDFTGTIPASVSSMSNLNKLDVSVNSLDGDLGAIIDNLPVGIGSVDLAVNSLTGTIPSSVSSLTNLWALYLSGNNLTGNLESILGYLPTSLLYLALDSNEFSGSIPASIQNFTSLSTFDIGYNPGLSGTIPMEITNLTLYSFNFHNTYLCEPEDPDYHTWKNTSVTYYSPGLCLYPLNGAAEITSDQPIVAIGRPHMGTEIMSYGGVNAGANTVYLPMLFYNTWGSYTSTFTVENTSGSTATFDITFKDALTGDTTCTMTSETLAQHEVRTYDVTALSGCVGMTSGWYGGATIESDQPVTAVAAPKVNGYDAVTYNGFTGGDTTAYLPMLFRGIWGYESAFYVQNLDPVESALIEIEFYDNQGVHTCTMADPDPIQSSVTRGYWMSSLSNSDCDPGDLGFSPSGWAGSAVISITGGGSSAIVAIGRPHMGAEVAAYNGFTTGGTTNYLPMLFRGQWGYDSAFYIQNISGVTANSIVVEFYDTVGNYVCALEDTDPLGDKATRGYWTPYIQCNQDGLLPESGWAGSVKIVTDQEVIAVGRPHLSNGQVAVYNAFTGGGTDVFVPMLFRNYGSNESALYIQNLSSTTEANTTITFYDEDSGHYCTMDKVVQPGASGAIWLAGLDNTECVP